MTTTTDTNSLPTAAVSANQTERLAWPARSLDAHQHALTGVERILTPHPLTTKLETTIMTSLTETSFHDTVAAARALAGPAPDIYFPNGYVSRGTGDGKRDPAAVKASDALLAQLVAVARQAAEALGSPPVPARNKGQILAEYSKAARALNGHSVPSRRITNTFSLAVHERARVENKTLVQLLAMLDGLGKTPGPVEWLVTTHETGDQGHTTTAMAVDGKHVVRARHASGVISMLKLLANESGGRVAYVKPKDRLGKGDLMRLRGVQFRGGRSCVIRVEEAGQGGGGETDPVAEAKARQVALAEAEQLEKRRQASAFSCVLNALCDLPADERKPLLKADGEPALRAWVDQQLALLYDTADASYRYRLDAVQLYRLQITAPEVLASRKAAAKA